MIKINEIPNNEEPRKKIVSKLEPHFKDNGGSAPWMAPNESSFICGLLQVFRPKKILEVGVAKGGTTAIVLQFLEDRNEPYEMHSVDLSKKLGANDIGFLATFAKENNLLTTPPRSTLCGTHEFHLGKYLPQVIDEIGGDIDFVILDTVHYTPGELLDFPVMLPYLKDGAIVVLHDVALNQRNIVIYHTPDAHATGLLLSTVVAEEKFLNYEPPRVYPNIGAFKISEQTRTNIENVFLALTLTWHYLPTEDEVAIYRDFYNKYYSAKLVEIFDETVRLNRDNVALKKPTAPAKTEVPPPKSDTPAKTEVPPSKPVAPAKTEMSPLKPDSTIVKNLSYQTHVSMRGWGFWINENQISEPLDQKFYLQAIKVQFPGHKVYYSVYYNDKEGWSEEVLSPEIAGTTGKSKPIYGMRIRLNEADTKVFDILYRMYKSDGEWTPWAKNDEALYSQGNNINAIQIKLEPKTV